jgi:hypothetical protein
MSDDKKEPGIPDFIFCGACLSPRDVYVNVDDLWVVEECEFCGDEHYAYAIQADAPSRPSRATTGRGSTFVGL